MSIVRQDTGLDGDEVDINITLRLSGVPEHVSHQIKDAMLEEAKRLLANRANKVLSQHGLDEEVRQV